MNLEDMAADLDLMDTGVWIEMTGGWGALIRSTENNDCKKIEAKHLQENRRFYQRKKLPDPETLHRQRIEMVTKVLLKDWKYLEDGEGNAIPYSIENAKKIFGDKRYSSMLDEVFDIASEAEAFRNEALEEESKSSDSPT